MSIVRYRQFQTDPLSSDGLRQMLDSLGHSTASAARVPAVDIVEEPSRFLIRADLPGVDPAGIDLLIERNELVLRGSDSLRWSPVKGGCRAANAVLAILSDALCCLTVLMPARWVPMGRMAYWKCGCRRRPRPAPAGSASAPGCRWKAVCLRSWRLPRRRTLPLLMRAAQRTESGRCGGPLPAVTMPSNRPGAAR